MPSKKNSKAKRPDIGGRDGDGDDHHGHGAGGVERKPKIHHHREHHQQDIQKEIDALPFPQIGDGNGDGDGDGVELLSLPEMREVIRNCVEDGDGVEHYEALQGEFLKLVQHRKFYEIEKLLLCLRRYCHHHHHGCPIPVPSSPSPSPSR